MIGENGTGAKHPWPIPRSWVWTTMGEVSEVVGGGTPRTGVDEYWDPPEIPWLTPADLSGYRRQRIGGGNRAISKLGLERSGARLLPAGTVLFSSRAPIGYVAIADRPMATNQGFKSFVLSDGVLPEFVYYYLKGNTQLATELGGGTTFLEISGRKAAQIPFVLAPFVEQERIVHVLDEHLSRLDVAVAALERASANLNCHRACVLQAACAGRLVPTEAELARQEGRDYESADALLERIIAERRARGKIQELELGTKGRLPKDDILGKKYSEAGVLDAGDLPRLPEGWTWSTVGELAESVVYGTSRKASSMRPGIPVLRMGNIVDGNLDFDDLKYLPSDEDEFPRLLLAPGDLLFNRTNSAELVGKTAVYLGRPEPCSFASYLIRVRLVPGILPRYVGAYINSPLGRRWATSVASQQVGQANINGSKLKAMAIPIPPLAEQARILEEMDRHLSLSEATKNAVEVLDQREMRLRQSILRNAFEGRLVPQDPSDEPASLVLERIRSESSTSNERRLRAARKA